MSGDEYVFLSVDGLANKYQKNIWSGALFLFLGLALIAGVTAYYYNEGVYHSDDISLQQILPIVLFFIPAYGWTLIRFGLKEKQLYYKAAMNGLLIDERGFSGPLALLEGPVRDILRDEKKPVFQIAWNSIEEFIIEPVRGSAKYSAPPYYKITIEGGGGGLNTSFFILREYFRGREEQVLDAVKEYLEEEQIIFNDELLMEGPKDDG